MYEGGTRIPLIARWQNRIKPAQLNETPVISTDWVPTFVELADISTTDKFDGVSLAKLLLNNEPLAARKLCWHYPHYTNQGSRPAGAIREGNYKLVEHYEDGRLELFDLSKDIGEATDISTIEPARVAELRGKLEAWRRELGVQDNTPNPNFSAALWKQLYMETDTTKLIPEGNAEAMGEKQTPWRKLMGAVVSKDKPLNGNGAGMIVLHAREAKVTGTKLKYENPPHKDTLGFWVNPADFPEWEFDAPNAGTFEVELVGKERDLVDAKQAAGSARAVAGPAGWPALDRIASGIVAAITPVLELRAELVFSRRDPRVELLDQATEARHRGAPGVEGWAGDLCKRPPGDTPSGVRSRQIADRPAQQVRSHPTEHGGLAPQAFRPQPVSGRCPHLGGFALQHVRNLGSFSLQRPAGRRRLASSSASTLASLSLPPGGSLARSARGQATASLRRNGSQLCRTECPRGIDSLGVQAGFTGLVLSFIPASTGVWSALRPLQASQAATQFSQLVGPPRERGTTWSMVSES